MNITITSKPTSEYLLIESKGTLESKDDLFMHSQRLYEEIIQYDLKKVLVYEPETTFPLELFSYFDLVQYYLDSFPPEIRYLKIAIVIAEEYKEIADFWETVCVNRGLEYFAFTSLEDAGNWLLS